MLASQRRNLPVNLRPAASQRSSAPPRVFSAECGERQGGGVCGARVEVEDEVLRGRSEVPQDGDASRPKLAAEQTDDAH
ncbi:hypothetical protein AOLI_G00106130 [Acnodon oligacanthus]